MVLGAPALTRLGFRRDVRLFLGTLVGFLIALIVVLLLLLQTFLRVTEDAIVNSWNTVADVVAAEISESTSSGVVGSQVMNLRGKYEIAGIAFIPTSGQKVIVGLGPDSENVRAVTRSVANGQVVVVFDDARIRVIGRIYWLSAIICLAAAAGGTLMLALYLPRITRPIEQMLDSAEEIQARAAHEDEQQYLIDIFRRSIATLKEQEVELKQLHEREKTRADELEHVSATLTRSMTSGLVTFDSQGRVLEINDAGREILQLPSGLSVAGHAIVDLIGESEFGRRLHEVVQERARSSRLELEHPVAGQPLIIGLAVTPLVSFDDRFLGSLALFTDLTPLRRLEARLRELQTLAAVGEISGAIAHEFRNSLSTILGYLRLVQKEPLAEAASARIRHAESEAVLLSEAITALLTFARPMQIQRIPVEVSEIVHDVVARLQPLTDNVVVSMRCTPLWIQGDAALLSRAIENLLRNSLESIAQKGEPGRIDVSCSSSPPTIVIRDNGVGFDPADAARLLLPFQSTKSGGFGIGLPLARKIVLLHGGTLQLSGEPGVGATVTIEMHMAALAAPMPHEAASAAQ